MQKRTHSRIFLFALLFLLAETLSLIHASTHAIYGDGEGMCELCLVADNLNSALTVDAFEFVSVLFIAFIIGLLCTSYIALFKASSPLPRAPPAT